MRCTEARPFDHGEQNIPLAKRMRGFHAELDRHLADESRRSADAQRERLQRQREDAATVKALVGALSKDRLIQLGRPHSLGIAQTRAMLLATGRTNPARLIAALSKEAA